VTGNIFSFGYPFLQLTIISRFDSILKDKMVNWTGSFYHFMKLHSLDSFILSKDVSLSNSLCDSKVVC
jgi:hypothetical protein